MMSVSMEPNGSCKHKFINFKFHYFILKKLRLRDCHGHFKIICFYSKVFCCMIATASTGPICMIILPIDLLSVTAKAPLEEN